MKIRPTSLLPALLMANIAYAETINVGLEKFPPLIIDAKSGYTINLLKALEEKSDLKFNISIMPYNRAKSELKSGRVDIIGHTPYQAETKEFYTYATEFELKMPVSTDLYAMHAKNFTNLASLKIGTPRGNEEFAGEVLGIPKEKFQTGDLEGLTQMLQAGRIDAIWFERGATMTIISRLKINGVHYSSYPKQQLYAGMATANTAKGKALKDKINSLLVKLNIEEIYKDYTKFNKLPASGMVSLDK